MIFIPIQLGALGAKNAAPGSRDFITNKVFIGPSWIGVKLMVRVRWTNALWNSKLLLTKLSESVSTYEIVQKYGFSGHFSTHALKDSELRKYLPVWFKNFIWVYNFVQVDVRVEERYENHSCKEALGNPLPWSAVACGHLHLVIILCGRNQGPLRGNQVMFVCRRSYSSLTSLIHLGDNQVYWRHIEKH